MIELLLAALLLIVGYVLGRWRPGPRILTWAVAAGRRPFGWRTWFSLPIYVVALTWQVTVHPIESARNRRTWREVEQHRFRGQVPEKETH